MKMIHISKCKPSGGGTDEDEDADKDDPIQDIILSLMMSGYAWQTNMHKEWW